MLVRKMKGITFSLIITLVIAVVMVGIALNATISTASAGTQATCYTYLYTTTCRIVCVPSDPNGCGTSKWSYYCTLRELTVYSNGHRYGSVYAGSGYYCSTDNCSMTCSL